MANRNDEAILAALRNLIVARRKLAAITDALHTATWSQEEEMRQCLAEIDGANRDMASHSHLFNRLSEAWFNGDCVLLARLSLSDG